MHPLTHTWRIGPLSTYTFYIYEKDIDWLDTPGLYIFTGQSSRGEWLPFYVGETGNFKTRGMPTHEDWNAAVELGATHVHAMVFVGTEQERLDLEKQFIQALRPPLNVQHNRGLLYR